MIEAPKGRRFSQLYVEPGPAQSDSKRARARIERMIEAFAQTTRMAIRAAFGRELGRVADLPSYDLHDFLDAITITYWTLVLRDMRASAGSWAESVERVFREENLAYRVDELGGVHPNVDPEFVRNVEATIRGVADSRFKAAHQALRDAQAHLDSGDTRGAIRRTFDACENVFKISFGKKATRLGAAEINMALVPRLQEVYEGAALHASKSIAKSFAEWVAAAHHYRHVEGVLDAAPPPDALSIVLVSQGFGYLRWLLDIDALQIA